jgi:hypothetical protein
MTGSQALRLGSSLLAFLFACDDAPPQATGGGGSASIPVGGFGDQGGGGAGVTAGGAAAGDAAGAGGEAEAPTCAAHAECDDFHGSWLLEAACDDPPPQPIPLYCGDDCVSASPECASSFIDTRFHLTAAELSFTASTLEWTGTGEQHGTLHVTPECAFASGHVDPAVACTPTGLGGQFWFAVADECNVEGDVCVCTIVSPLELAREGAFIDVGDGLLTAGSLELEQCAAADALWIGPFGGYPAQLYRRR